MFTKLFYGQAIMIGAYGLCSSGLDVEFGLSLVIVGLSSYKLLQIGYSDKLKMDKTSNYKKKLLVIGNE